MADLKDSVITRKKLRLQGLGIDQISKFALFGRQKAFFINELSVRDENALKKRFDLRCYSDKCSC